MKSSGYLNWDGEVFIDIIGFCIDLLVTFFISPIVSLFVKYSDKIICFLGDTQRNIVCSRTPAPEESRVRRAPFSSPEQLLVVSI